MATPAQLRANAKYHEKFEEIRGFRVTPERKDEMLAHIRSRGESMNAFLARAVAETMERDNQE